MLARHSCLIRIKLNRFIATFKIIAHRMSDHESYLKIATLETIRLQSNVLVGDDYDKYIC